MYAVVITDEGGVQRRLEFSKPELTVGRVQGNDIVLPKRNVSKQHARLVLKDEQPFVVDLDSTNGTWVNGRKIASPHPLKQGDKIYIADFILTVEPTQEGEQRASVAPRFSEPPAIPTKEPPSGATSRPAQAADVEPAEQSTGRPPPSEEKPTSAPPRPERRQVAPSRAAAKTQTAVPAADPLKTLLARLGERIDVDTADPAAMKNQERWSAMRAAIAETFLAMQTEGVIDPSVDMRRIAHVALHEAVGLGALDELLSDESVRTVLIQSAEHVFVDRGEGLTSAASKFSSATALRRVARRLAAQAGQAWNDQAALHGRLSFGPKLTILQPPLVMHGPVIEIQIDRGRSLSELATDGWMSQDAATILTKAVAECRNIVVAGADEGAVARVTSALARELPDTECVVAIESVPALHLDRERLVSVTASNAGISLARAIEYGSSLQAERLIVHALDGADALAALAAIGGREPGHLVGIRCWSAKDAIEGIMLAAGCNGTQRACVAELIAHAVDLVVAVQRRPEGPRVTAILEIQGTEGGDVSYESVAF